MENRALERTVWSGFNCDRADCQGKCVADPRKHVLATDYAALEARLASLDQKFMVLQGSHDLLAAELKKEKEGSRCFKLTAKACVRALENEKKELIADRDEWKRRCGKIIKFVDEKVPAEKQPTETLFQFENRRRYHNAQIQMGCRIKAIAEGRDNG